MSRERKRSWTENEYLFPALMSVGFFAGVFISKWIMGVAFGTLAGMQIAILVASAVAGMAIGVGAAQLIRSY